MDPQVSLIIVTSISAFASIVGVFDATLAAYWAYKAKLQSNDNALKIEEVHTATNSMKDELVRATAAAAHAAGMKEQREETKSQEDKR